jgi:protein PhnA
MAKGLDKHQHRIGQLNGFGKDLARRARSHCELCDVSGVKLNIFEVAPIPVEPDYDACILICDICSEQLNNPKRIDPDHWRCLNKSMWSEVSIVQVAAIRMIRLLAVNHDWAADLNDMAYLEPEVEKRISQQ